MNKKDQYRLILISCRIISIIYLKSCHNRATENNILTRMQRSVSPNITTLPIRRFLVCFLRASASKLKESRMWKNKSDVCILANKSSKKINFNTVVKRVPSWHVTLRGITGKSITSLSYNWYISYLDPSVCQCSPPVLAYIEQ